MHRLAAPSGDCFRNRVPSEASLLRCISRIGPCQPTRDASGTVGPHRTLILLRDADAQTTEDQLVPFGSSSPLAGPVIVHRPCKVLGLDKSHNSGQTRIMKIHFSPVTDVLGRIRRCQRSTCVDAVLPAHHSSDLLRKLGFASVDTRRGKKNQYTRGFPSNSWNDSTNGDGASMAATAKTRAANPSRKSSAYIRSEQMHVHQTYRHATGRRMTLPCVPTGISSGS